MITRHFASKATTDDHVRCERCHKLLAERATRPWRISCVRCGHTNLGDPRGAAYEPAEQPQSEAKPRTEPKPRRKAPARRRRKATSAAALA